MQIFCFFAEHLLQISDFIIGKALLLLGMVNLIQANAEKAKILSSNAVFFLTKTMPRALFVSGAAEKKLHEEKLNFSIKCANRIKDLQSIYQIARLPLPNESLHQ